MPCRHASAPGPPTRNTVGVVTTTVAPWRTRSSRARSSRRSSSGMGPGQLGGVVAGEGGPDEIRGPAGALAVGRGEHCAAEPRRTRSREAGERVLDDHAAGRHQLELGTGAVVALRVRLARAHVLSGDDLAEVRAEAGQIEHQLELPPERTA